MSVINDAKKVYGKTVPAECDGNIIRVRAFQEKFREVRANGRQRRKQRQE